MKLNDLMHRLSNVRARKKKDSIERRVFHLFEEVWECAEYVRDGKSLSKITTEKDDAGIPKPEGFPIELADVVIEAIRIFEDIGVDPDTAIEMKITYHEARRATKQARKKVKVKG